MLSIRNLLFALSALSLVIVALLTVNSCGHRALVRERQTRALAQDDAAGRKLEATGSKAIERATAAARAQIQTDKEAAHALDIDAHSDPSASAQLPPSVRARVRSGDQRLCGQPGAVCR